MYLHIYLYVEHKRVPLVLSSTSGSSSGTDTDDGSESGSDNEM